MDVNIWEKTIVTWLNSLSDSSPISNINQISENHLTEVIRKIKCNFEKSSVEFLKDVFPNFTECKSFKLNLGIDYLCASTLLLIYASLSNNEEVNEIRQLMCSKLDTSLQIIIVEFLNKIQKHENIFMFSFNKFKKEILPHVFFNFQDKQLVQNLVLGDGDKTPVKNDVLSNSFDSPLQEFFQTPKRNTNIHMKKCYNMCGDGSHIKRLKKLTDQLVEEESEKASLQEQLIIQTQKCNDFEIKLKAKIEEINNLKEDLAREVKKNEEEINSLKNNMSRKVESEKKFKGEISYLENYITKLESDLSACMLKNDKLEDQLGTTVERFAATEDELKNTTELCTKLQNAIKEKERELVQLKENYENVFHDEKSIDVSFMNGSLDKSVNPPENLGVVVEKLLGEKIEENDELRKTIEKLRHDKNSLMEQLNALEEKLALKSLAASELQFLKKELNKKTDSLRKTEEELVKIQNELLSANAEIKKLKEGNSHLFEKFNILNDKLKEREQLLINSNNSKMHLQINFLKLAEDFKIVEQLLEMEVNNISELILGESESLRESVVYLKSKEFSEIKDPVNIFTVKNLNYASQNDQNIHKTETTSLNSFLSSDDKISNQLDVSQKNECRMDWTESKASLQKTYNQISDSIIVLKEKLNKLQEQKKNYLKARSNLELNLREANEKIKDIQSNFTNEIQKLELALLEKDNKIKELEKTILDLTKKEEKLFFVKENKIEVPEIPPEKPVPEIVLYKSTQKQNLNDVVNTEERTGGTCERQEFSDSLEEVPVNNKTFDIVNLEEKNISDKTFSIKKENTSCATSKNGSAWIVSPPSKVPVKIPSKDVIKHSAGTNVRNESWTIPANPLHGKQIRAKKVSSSVHDLRVRTENMKLSEFQKDGREYAKECERLRAALLDSVQKREKDKESYEKNQEIIRQNITVKYESQLDHLKSEMKQLYNRELAKHKQELSNINSELRDQNKRYKEHIDELRNQLWDLGEKLLQEQTLKRDLERNLSDLKEKYENLMSKSVTLNENDRIRHKESLVEESNRTSFRQIPNATFPIIPNEDEDEVFDNRFLEDVKTGICEVERPEHRLKELQYRNSLCLPHLKSSYPAETQFHNPTLFKESDLKFGALPFIQESQSLTDSDQSMTKSLLPDNKGKKKEQTSYKRPGPPTPSKNGGRLSIQSGDVRLTPRNVLKELNDQNERNKGTPNPLKFLLTSKNIRRSSVGSKDENMAPVTPRKKKFFRKPFGARD